MSDKALTTTGPTGPKGLDVIAGGHLDDFVTFMIGDQMLGIPVLQVQDILQSDKIASIPLAPPEVKGSINLRGRIVTVFNVRQRLGLKPLPAEEEKHCMGVTVELEHELYTLQVDRVGDVIGLPAEEFENNPGTLDALWREFTTGVYRLEERIMVVLDVERLLNLDGKKETQVN
jgi:purine-binding chemotaxis protein CheW